MCRYCGKTHNFKECRDKYPFYKPEEVKSLLDKGITPRSRSIRPNNNNNNENNKSVLVASNSNNKNDNKNKINIQYSKDKCIECKSNFPRLGFQICVTCYLKEKKEKELKNH